MATKKGVDYIALIKKIGVIFAFLSGLVKVLSYFFDPAERERRRLEKLHKLSLQQQHSMNNAIDDGDEDEINEIADEVIDRRKGIKNKKRGRSKNVKKTIKSRRKRTK